METLPSYYAAIPANVRYAKISSTAKIVYAELTICEAWEWYTNITNKELANRFWLSARQISTCLKELLEERFIWSFIDSWNERLLFINK